MSMRRPRIKAVANLAPRKTTSDKSKIGNKPTGDTTKTSIDDKKIDTVEVSVKAKINEDLTNENPNDDATGLKSIDSEVKNYDDLPSAPPITKLSETTLTETVVEQQSIKPVNNVITTPDHADVVLEENVEIVNKENDSVFKSPMSFSNTNHLMNQSLKSPSINSQVDDYLKFPMSPTKVRQRIKPTPIFGKRRGSFQGKDEPEVMPKRQRHTSTSSNHSLQNFNIPTKGIPNSPSGSTGNVGPCSSSTATGGVSEGRIRTESVCSNASDLSVIKDITSKMPGTTRRAVRSEETLRIVEKRRSFRDRFQNSTPDKTQLRMFDMIYYNPVTNPMKSSTNIKEERRGSSTNSVSSFVTRGSERGGSAAAAAIARGTPPPSQTPPVPKKEETAMPVPQLKIGADGEIIIDEKSLVIETTYEKEARKTIASADVVYDDEFNTTQGFYKRQQRTKDWNVGETIKFYRCLHTIGTDFSMMVSLFKNRSRRDLKVKFKKEEKMHPHLVNKVLCNPKSFNIEKLESDLKLEEEAAPNPKEISEQLAKTNNKRVRNRKTALMKVKKDNPQGNVSLCNRALTDGDYIYENEDLLSLSKLRKSLTNGKSKKLSPVDGIILKSVREKTNRSLTLDGESDNNNVESTVDKSLTSPSQSSSAREKPKKKSTKSTLEPIERVDVPLPGIETLFMAEENGLDHQQLDNELNSTSSSCIHNNQNISRVSIDKTTAQKILDENYQLLNLDDFSTTNFDYIENLPIEFEKDQPTQTQDDDNVDDLSPPTPQTDNQIKGEPNTSTSLETTTTITLPIANNLNSTITPSFVLAECERILEGHDVSGYFPMENTTDATVIEGNLNILPMSPPVLKNTVEITRTDESNTYIVSQQTEANDHNDTTQLDTCNDPLINNDPLQLSTETSHTSEQEEQAEEDQHPEDILQSPHSSGYDDNDEDLSNFGMITPKTEKCIKEEKQKKSENELAPDRTPKEERTEKSSTTPTSPTEDTNDDLASLMKRLVVVVSQHPDDPNETINEIYLMCPDTGRLSEKPLDLPQEIIDNIIASQE